MINPPSINPYDELNSILAKSENKKRKLTVEYITPFQSSKGINSAQTVLGLDLSNLYSDNFRPPFELDPDLVIIPGLPNPEYKEPVVEEGVDVGVIDQPGKWEKPTQGGHNNPGGSLELIEEEENAGEGEGDNALNPPPPPVPVEADYELEEARPQGDINVGYYRDPNDSNKIHYAVRDPNDPSKWYKIEFVKGYIDNQIFLFQGMLYQYNPDDKIWQFMTPPGNYDETNHYHNTSVLGYSIEADGSYSFTFEQGYFNILPNEDGYFVNPYNGELMAFSTEAMILYPIGSDTGVGMRETLLKNMAQTYTTEQLQDFMFHNYGDYYWAWQIAYPNVYPLSQAQYDSQYPMIVALQWMYITKGAEYAAQFLIDHPDWSIAQSILHPYTSIEQFFGDQIQSQFDQYAQLTPIQQITFQRSFELTWIMDQNDVKQFFQTNLQTQLDAFMSAQKEFSSLQNPSDEQKQSFFRITQALVMTALQLCGANGSPVAGAMAGVGLEMGFSFMALQIIRGIAFYGYGFSLSPTLPGVLLQTAVESAENISFLAETGYQGTMSQFVQYAASNTQPVQFAEAFINSLKTGFQNAVKMFSTDVTASSGFNSASKGTQLLIQNVFEDLVSGEGSAEASILELENMSIDQVINSAWGDLPNVNVAANEYLGNLLQAGENIGEEEVLAEQTGEFVLLEGSEVAEEAAAVAASGSSSGVALISALSTVGTVISITLNVIGVMMVIYSLYKVIRSEIEKKANFDYWKKMYAENTALWLFFANNSIYKQTDAWKNSKYGNLLETYAYY